VTQTAVYFNPELDAVHVVDEFGSKFQDLCQYTNKETIQSIKMLVVGSRLYQDDLKQQTVMSLLPFKRLETLIFLQGEAGRDEDELIREDMEDKLAKVMNRLVLPKVRQASQLPAVKVRMMDAHTVACQLWT
jgi:hypothetical protein